MIDWQVIKTEYITLGTSYRKLAEKYGVSRTQIGNVGRDEKWVELRKQHLDRTVSNNVAAVEEANAKRAKKVQSVADKLLGKIDQMVDVLAPSALNAKAIRSLTAAVKDLKEISGVKSELDQQEQQARIDKLRREAQKEDQDKDGKVEVVFDGGDLEEWSG